MKAKLIIYRTTNDGRICYLYKWCKIYVYCFSKKEDAEYKKFLLDVLGDNKKLIIINKVKDKS